MTDIHSSVFSKKINSEKRNLISLLEKNEDMSVHVKYFSRTTSHVGSFKELDSLRSLRHVKIPFKNDLQYIQMSFSRHVSTFQKNKVSAHVSTFKSDATGNAKILYKNEEDEWRMSSTSQE